MTRNVLTSLDLSWTACWVAHQLRNTAPVCSSLPNFDSRNPLSVKPLWLKQASIIQAIKPESRAKPVWMANASVANKGKSNTATRGLLLSLIATLGSSLTRVGPPNPSVAFILVRGTRAGYPTDQGAFLPPASSVCRYEEWVIDKKSRFVSFFDITRGVTRCFTPGNAYLVACVPHSAFLCQRFPPCLSWANL